MTAAHDAIQRLSENFLCTNDELEQIYAAARTGHAVHYLEDIDFWAVTRYDDVKSILRDTDAYSCEIAMDPITPFSAEMRQILSDGEFAGRSNMVANASETHNRIRRHAQLGFTPKRLEWIEPFVRDAVNEHIDRFDDEGSVDLVAAMLYELPAIVLFKLLGFPVRDVARVKRWADHRLLMIFGRPTPKQQRRAACELVAYWRYCVRLVEEKEKHPGDDLTSDILAARGGDENQLSIDDVRNIVFGLLLAGHETTSNLSANAVLALLENEAAWQELVDHPERISGTVEELIRYRPSVVAWRRKARKNVEISGQRVPQGARLLLFLAAANRDESIFQDGDNLDLRREDARSHLSFGYGAHFCIGAPMARLELKVILEELTRRLPRLRLQAPQAYDFIETLQFRGPKKLMVEWH